MSLINLTDTAKTHLIALAKEHNKKYVRLEVKGGGCAGFKYDWSFDDEPSKDDEKLDFNEFSLLVDKSSLLMLSGMTMNIRKKYMVVF